MNDYDDIFEEEFENTLKAMIADGQIKAEWSSYRGEFLYSLTEKGKDLQRKEAQGKRDLSKLGNIPGGEEE